MRFSLCELFTTVDKHPTAGRFDMKDKMVASSQRPWGRNVLPLSIDHQLCIAHQVKFPHQFNATMSLYSIKEHNALTKLLGDLKIYQRFTVNTVHFETTICIACTSKWSYS